MKKASIPKGQMRLRARKNPNPRASRSVAVQLPIPEVDRSLLQQQSRFWPWTRQTQLLALRRMSMFNPILRSYMVLAKNGIIGSTPIHPTFSSVRDKKKREKLEQLWNEFCCSVSIDGQMTMRQYQRALAHQYLVDGRAFGIVHYSDGYPHGFAIQGLPREALAEGVGETKNENTQGGMKGRRLRFGVVYDALGMIVGYRFWKDSKNIFVNQGGGYTPWAQTGGEVEEIPAARVMDVKNNERLDEWDASPSWILSSLDGLMGVNELDLTTLKTMRAAACKMGFYERELGSIDSGEDVDATSNNAGEDEEWEDEEEADLPEKMAHGSIDELPPGWKFSGFDPSWPNVDGVQYRLQLLRPVIAALGGDYNSVCADGVGVNYNSLRHMTLQVRDHWRSVQDDIRDDMIKPLYKVWLEMAIMRGDISLSKKVREEAMRTPFAARAYPWVDPAKDVMAKEKQLGMGIISPQDAALESGRNIQDVLADWAALRDQIESLGGLEEMQKIMSLFTDKKGAAPAPESDEEGGEDEDGKDKDKGKEKKDANGGKKAAKM